MPTGRKGFDMAIGNALQKQGFVYIYDENGRQLATVSAGSNNGKDGLTGYTNSRVNVRRGNMIYSYDEHGHQVSSQSAP
jgi:hypothetical protein